MRFVIHMALLAAVLQGQESDRKTLEKRVVEHYAVLAHASYAAAEREARAMRDVITAFLATPSADGLAAARRAWVEARIVYGPTEVFRFYAGPIDNPKNGVEALVNAWPLDESFIDGVKGRPSAGIVNDPKKYPVISKGLLQTLNMVGGESHVTTGWHAIEFLLWGQDLHADGPGKRPHTDFVDGEAPNAARRREYLRVVTDLLVEHLAQVTAAWAPTVDNYRRSFVARPRDGIRRILPGMCVLSGFEMSGERMAVPYETRDQEEEHSCFSDTTHLDLIANQRGLCMLWTGERGELKGPGLRALARHVARPLAEELDGRLARGLTALSSLPVPFDTLLLAKDGSEARAAMLAAIEALEAQTRSLSDLGLELGYRVPLQPRD